MLAVLPFMPVGDLVRVLLVEDDIAVARILSRALVAAGYRVDHAIDGADGLDRLLGGTFDVVVSDVCMPRLGGLEFVERARKLRPDISVIMMSGTLDADAYVTAHAMGTIRYMLKPVGLQQLTRAVAIAAKLREGRLRAQVRRRERQHPSGEYCVGQEVDGTAEESHSKAS